MVTTEYNPSSSDPAAAANANASALLVPPWLQSQSAHHFWACLVQPLYEPLTNRALPPLVTLPLAIALAVSLLTRLGAFEGAVDASSSRLRSSKRRARAKRRRWALWGRLRSLPVYSILFAYVASGNSKSRRPSQTLLCGWLPRDYW